VFENIAASTTYGEAGNLKLPHAITLHSIQAIPPLGVLIASLGLSSSLGRFWVGMGSLGFLGFSVIAQTQAYLGKAFHDLDAFSGFALWVSLLAFVVPYGYGFIAFLASKLCRRDARHAFAQS